RVCVVDEPKFRMIHDLMLSGRRLPTRNNDVGFAQAPDCPLGHMLTRFSVCNYLHLARRFSTSSRRKGRLSVGCGGPTGCFIVGGRFCNDGRRCGQFRRWRRITFVAVVVGGLKSHGVSRRERTNCENPSGGEDPSLAVVPFLISVIFACYVMMWFTRSATN
ncbi:unnamed protein product, partial [Ectocarpus fasciculatus]